MELSCENIIDAPRNKVFTLITEPDNLKIWMTGVVETVFHAMPDNGSQVGRKFTQKIKEGGKISEYQGEVLAYDPGMHFAIRLGNKHYSMRVDYRLHELAPGKTKLNYLTTTESNSWFVKLMGKLFKGYTNKILKKHMANLKQLAEQG